MKYLCMAYEEETKLSALSHDQWTDLRTETLAYVDELRTKGYLITAEALQSTRTAASIRVRDNKLLVTDGPFADTKEHLGGIFLIEARDFNEAIQVASRWPSARLGTVEVRPIEPQLSEEQRYH